MSTESVEDWEEGVRYRFTVWYRKRKKDEAHQQSIILPTASWTIAVKWANETLKHIRCGTDFMTHFGKAEVIQMRMEHCKLVDLEDPDTGWVLSRGEEE